MSSRNVDVVKKIMDAFAQGDRDTALTCLDSEVHWEESARGGFTGLRPVYRGHAGFATWWAQVSEPWQELRPEPEEFIDAGDDVLCACRLHGRGRGSDVPVVSQTMHDVYTVRDGKIVRRRLYATRKEAREAVGLKA
jgi:ketosteroid isomerase-like protein